MTAPFPGAVFACKMGSATNSCGLVGGILIPNVLY